jgi:hypothetical protein
VPAPVVHPDRGGGAAAWPPHRTAPGQARIRDRWQQPIGRRCRRRVRAPRPTAHKALVAAAAHWLPEPEPTAVLGIDETRFGSVRWLLDGITWRRSEPSISSPTSRSPDRKDQRHERVTPAQVRRTRKGVPDLWAVTALLGVLGHQ